MSQRDKYYVGWIN